MVSEIDHRKFRNFKLAWQQKSSNVVFLTSDRRIRMNLHNFSTHRQPLLTGDWVLYAWGTKCYTGRWSWGGPTLSGNIWQGTRTACSAGSNACGQGSIFRGGPERSRKETFNGTIQRTFPGTGICYGEASWGRCPTIGIRVPVLGGQSKESSVRWLSFIVCEFLSLFYTNVCPANLSLSIFLTLSCPLSMLGSSRCKLFCDYTAIFHTEKGFRQSAIGLNQAMAQRKTDKVCNVV